MSREHPASSLAYVFAPTLQLDWTWYDKGFFGRRDEGVYVVCTEAQTPITAVKGELSRATIYVGSGNIRDRINEALSNPEVRAYEKDGAELNVACALVDSRQREGIERYLANVMKPRVGERHPDVDPIPATLPY